jgi:hypothetical protein
MRGLSLFAVAFLPAAFFAAFVVEPFFAAANPPPCLRSYRMSLEPDPTATGLLLLGSGRLLGDASHRRL